MTVLLSIYFTISAILTIMARPWENSRNPKSITIAFFLIGIIGIVSGAIALSLDSLLSRIEDSYDKDN